MQYSKIIFYSQNIKDSNNLTVEYRNFEANYNEKSTWVKHLEEEI